MSPHTQQGNNDKNDLLNPLGPNSDKNEISLYIITTFV